MEKQGSSMQGHKADARRWIVLATSVMTVGLLVVAMGWSGNPAGAATDGLVVCVTPTVLPTGTPATGTPSASPTTPPPTATVPQVVGRLLGDAPATATATASPTPLPTCTPTPAPTKSPPTPTVIATAAAKTLAVANGATTGSPSPPATTVPPATAVAARASAQSAPAPASVAAPVPAAPSSSTSSSSSSGPPPAAVGLPPPPPSGYSVGNTPNSAGGVPTANFPSTVGTPVVSAARGNVAPAGAASIPFPGSAPVAARSVAPPGYAIGSTGVPVPVITPRAGHPQRARGADFALLFGTISVFVGMKVRRESSRRAVRA